MPGTGKILEKFISEVWRTQHFNDLITYEDQPIEIIEIGTENSENGGPDFINARIKIGSLTFLGDVEIDSVHNDWVKHGHHLNKKFNKTILHVVLENDRFKSYVYTENGRKINSVCIEKFIDGNLHNHIRKAIKSEAASRISKVRCHNFTDLTEEKTKTDFIISLGLERFKSKCARYLERLKEIIYIQELKAREPMINYSLNDNFYNRKFTQTDFSNQQDWNQLLHEAIFEALGYSANKYKMGELARNVDLAYLSSYKNEKNFIHIMESIFYKAAGLVPVTNDFTDQETTNYKRHITETWSNLPVKYDGKILKHTDWNFVKSRPLNFPTLRIAGGVRIVHKIMNARLFNHILLTFKKDYMPRSIISELKRLLTIRAEGFWGSHYNFNSRLKAPISHFIGFARGDEIIINVILPLSAIYFEIYNKKFQSKRVLDTYLAYSQNCDNHLVNQLADTLRIKDQVRKSVIQQGIIALFRQYCSTDSCPECLIGQKIFN